MDAATFAESYERVRAYLEAHPEIAISTFSLSVPEGLRGEFYGLVDDAQRALCAEVLGDGRAKLEQGAERIAEVRADLLARTGLERIELPAGVESFIFDPVMVAAKPLFGIVLEGLQRGKDADALAAEGEREVPRQAGRIARVAYELWVYFGIIRELKPVSLRAVVSHDTVAMEVVDTGTITVGAQITSPERRMPEAVFETEDGRAFAFKLEVANELDFYGVKITKRRDTSSGGNTAGVLSHRLLMLYEIADMAQPPMLADRDTLTVLPTTLTCEVLAPEELSVESFAAQFFERCQTLRSKNRVQVATFSDEGGFPQGIVERFADISFDRRVVGFDESAVRAMAELV